MALPAALLLGSKRTLAGAALIVLAVFAFIWVLFTNTRSLAEAAKNVEHTWTVVGELEATLSTLNEAETVQQGYLLTKTPFYLGPYDIAVAAVRGHLARLRSLTSDNPSQQTRLVELEDLVKMKLDELAETIRLFSVGDASAALRPIEAGFGKQLMDRIRRSVGSMRAAESALLAHRSERAAMTARRVTAASLIGGLSFLALIAGFLAVVRMDLLGRARAQADVRDTEALLSTTLRSIGDAVLATGSDGRIMFLNPVAERLTGWSAADALGRPVEDVFRILNEGSRAAVESPVRKVIRDGVVVGLADHTILVSRDGTELPVADSVAPIPNARGDVAGVVLVFRNITEQRLSERATQRLASIVASAEFAIVGETLDNVITDWNPGAEALFGFTASEMIGGRTASLAPPEAPDPSAALTAELLAGRRVAEFDARRVTKDGRWIDVVVTLSPMRDQSGAVIGISRLIRDVTDRRLRSRELEEARHQAQEASAAKDRFLATLSHELRTPLTPVVASVHRLERRADLGPGMAESLAMIRRNIELEARLIDDLLDLTRISRGKVELDRSPLNLHALLLSVAQNSRSEFFNKGIQLVIDLSAEDHYCNSDGARLQQVFWNLLRNSAKFTPAGGHVTLRSENPAPGQIRVIVTDTGRGIRPNILPRIFEDFEQGDVTAVGRARGLGLGLSIARTLVELHGGSISGASEGENRGASFTVELTTTQSRPAAAPLPAGGEKQITARQDTSILIVEDDVDTGEALHQLLSEAGFDVRLGDSVAAAARIFRERPAKILVTDVGLPDGNGLDLFGSLKALSPQLRAIVLSGYGMEKDVERSRALGFAEHFVKPLNLNRLIEALDAMGAHTG